MSDLVMNPEGFGLKIYNRFPARYQEDDVQTNFALKRYLDVCGEAGFRLAIQEWNGILDFANPDQATPQALPLLYQQYGLDLFYGIPEQYLRYLLPRLGEAWAKKGSLDVIEFVVSSLTGIKTITEVSHDEKGNANVDIYLQMDYNVGDYFPDPKQFERLIDKFLPFYLGKAIIYSFVFADTSDLHMDEDSLDRVNHSIKEKGLIVSNGFGPMKTTNNLDKLVNSTFTTNGWEQIAPIPDVYVDRIIPAMVHEQANFNLRWSGEYFTSVWNKERTNLNLYTNRRMETDECQDKISLFAHETVNATPKDKYKDNLVIGRNVLYVPMTNTGFLTNLSVYTNQLNLEEGVLNKEEDTTDSIKVASSIEEGVTLVMFPVLFTNFMSRGVNECSAGVPDAVDVVTYKDGTKVTMFLP